MSLENEELIDLACKFHDELISPAEMLRLERLLESEAARRQFLALSNVHFELKAATLSAEDESLARKLAAVHSAIIPDRHHVPVSIRGQNSPSNVDVHRRKRRKTAGSIHWRNALQRPSIRYATLTATAVAALSVFILLMTGRHNAFVPQAESSRLVADRQGSTKQHQAAIEKLEDQSSLATGFVARILAATSDARWKIEGKPDFLMRLATGDRIELLAGFITIEFSGQSEILLHAPAELQIEGASSARLFSGFLTGKSHDGSFRLRTPTAEVIDVGTEFGVSVDDLENTDVSVFDGEVHVGPMPLEALPESLFRLTEGMSARVDHRGFIRSDTPIDSSSFRRTLPDIPSTTLGTSEISLIDLISGAAVGESRLAGSIDPATGFWGQPPLDEPRGVERRSGEGAFVATNWNQFVDGVFVPGRAAGPVQVDSSGHSVRLPENCGSTWGPIWGRRRIDGDPLVGMLDQDEEAFWGSGTVTALLDRLRWAGEGVVGMYPNVGISFDLQAIALQRGRPVRRFRGIIAHLERSHESSPLYPHARADFRVYVDGELRYERLRFRRSDGDAQFGVEIHDDDRFLTLIATDGEGQNFFDHTVLIDPVLEFANR